MVLWGRSVLGCQKVPQKLPPRLRQGLTKVSPRFQKLRKFRVGVPKGSVEGPLSTSLNLSPSSSTFLAFFPNSVSFTDSEGFGATMTRLSCGVLAPQQMAKTPPKKALGSSWSHSLLVFFGQMAFAAEKVLWRVLPTILCICLPNGCCFNFFFWRAPPPVLYIYLPVFCWVKVAWIVDTSHPYKSSPQKDPSCRCCWGILWVNYLNGVESCFDAVSAFMSAIRYRLKKHLSLAASDFEFNKSRRFEDWFHPSETHIFSAIYRGGPHVTPCICMGNRGPLGAL